MVLLAEEDGRPATQEKAVATPHGIYKRKYHLRALFQSIAFVALLGGYQLYGNYNSEGFAPTDTFQSNNYLERQQLDLGEELSSSQTLENQRRLLEADGVVNNNINIDNVDLGAEEITSMLGESHRRRASSTACDETAEPTWFLVWYSLGVLYMFLAIAIVCDEFFVEALEEISSPRRMNIGKDVAGATLMAAGGSAPELFTNLFGTFDESEIGFGTILGSAAFNVLLVIAMCSICAKETLDLTWWPLFRDTSYYAVGLVVLAIFVGVTSPDEIEVWEAVVLFLMYIGYVLIMWQNRALHKSLTGKELVTTDLNDDTSGDDESGNIECVKEQFDKLDHDDRGAVPTQQLRILLSKISSDMGDFNLDEAVADILHGQDTEATTWEDFADWYRNSVFFARVMRDAEDETEPIWGPLMIPDDAEALGVSWHLLQLPILICLVFTIPDVRRPGNEKWCYLAFLISILWIGAFAYFMVGWTEIIGNTIGVPHVVMGYTVLAAGTSVPDLLSSVIVTRQGSGDMAISSSIGSNIFDITVGLPIPWLLYMAFPNRPNTIAIDSANIWISICVFLAMLVLVVVTIHCQGWRLTKTLGAVMCTFYVVFLVQAIILELPFEACI